jgi:inorganic pyrophosphatase
MSDCSAVIEIPYGSNVKYELDENGRIHVDRILSTSMVYPGNYGYIDNTLAGDGDPLDILIINHTPFYPGSIVDCRVIGVLETSDEKGGDEKIIALPSAKIDAKYNKTSDIDDITPEKRAMIWHFFENYKKLETGKYVNVLGFKGRDEAIKVIEKSRETFLYKKKC